ncbi:MAG TPA: hypothetical protein PLS87_11660, partial [Ferruginibacter sp.]|nr:hypothetical protein [Ferruginibacter sp.]HRO97715.1 hypothetical protein [Ferruginibacter sp.]
MAKIYHYAICILLLCNCNNSGVPEIGVDNPATLDSVVGVVSEPEPEVVIEPDTSPVVEPEPEAVPPAAPTRTLDEVYTSYIGVREATGKNDGQEVELFLKSVGLGKGYPWCAAFVKHCLLEANVPGVDKINGMALSCENKNRMIFKSRQMFGEPKPGDVFTLYYAHLKRIGHTG